MDILGQDEKDLNIDVYEIYMTYLINDFHICLEYTQLTDSIDYFGSLLISQYHNLT